MIDPCRRLRKGLAELQLGSPRYQRSFSAMEDPMCWEMDYHWLAEQKKAEDAKAKQEQRAQAIDKLLREAQSEKSDEAAPAKETIPAK
jgi:hypothetical protein